MAVFCFSRKSNAMRTMQSRAALEKANAKKYACIMVSLVLSLVVVPGEKEISAGWRVRLSGVHACKVLASPWWSGCWLAREVAVAALAG
jgi:hypothetical protein